MPANYKVLAERSVNTGMKIFSFTPATNSIDLCLPRFVASYMPNLVQLVIEPDAALVFHGLELCQMADLAAMPALERVSVPLSVRDCRNNMPAVSCLLANMQCLKYLGLTWACLSRDELSKVYLMTNFLKTVLVGMNADIVVQLNARLHPDHYIS